MRTIKRWLSDLLDPSTDMDIHAIGQALNDHATRGIWMSRILDDIKGMNTEVDRRLLLGSDVGLTHLCARRQAYRDILESVLSAQRLAVEGTQSKPHNRPIEVNLDRVTG